MFWKKVIRTNILILLEKSIRSSADTYCAEIAKVIEGKAEQVAAHGLFYDGTFIREIYNTLQRELDTYFDITFGEINKLQSDLNILINDQEFAEIEKILQRTYRSLVGFNN